MTVEQLIAKITDTNADVRCAAWQSAGNVGAAAVEPLAAIADRLDTLVGCFGVGLSPTGAA